jgi:hypothetical protein
MKTAMEKVNLTEKLVLFDHYRIVGDRDQGEIDAFGQPGKW